MKKTLSILLSLTMLLTLCACGKDLTEPTDTEASTIIPTESTTETPVVPTDTEVMADPTLEIGYISDRSVQYNEAENQYVVFFGLQDMANRYTSSSGIAEIVITDGSDTVIYKRDISFSSADFTDWTNRTWDSSRYLCGLYIDRSDLDGAASSSGKLSLAVTLDNGIWFAEKLLAIYDLPPVSVKINLPEIPCTYLDTRYSSYTSTVEITKLTYETKVNSSGTATLSVEAVMKLVSKTGKVNESNTVCVGYKLYDSDGIVVDSGHIYSNPIAIGEASKESFSIYDLDPRETYTLVFMNAS